MDKVPSFRIMTELVFYKFYPDQRKPIDSDVYDITISLTFPYTNAVITEGNIKEIVNKIKRRTNFLKDLEVRTIREM